MALADWTLTNDGLNGYTSVSGGDSGVTWPAVGAFDPNDFLDGDIPKDLAINGSRCLTMAASGGSSLATGHAFRAHTAIRGRMDALVRVNGAYSVPMHCGLCVLQSQATLLPGGGGVAYAVTLDTILGQQLVRLVQLTNGIQGSPGGAIPTDYMVLAESPAARFTPGLVQGLTLAWDADPLVLHGTRLRVGFQDVATPFVWLWDIVHTGLTAQTPVSPVGVGCFLSYGTNTIVTYFDEITVAGAP